MLSPEPWIRLCLKDFSWPSQALPLKTKRGFINADIAAWKGDVMRDRPHVAELAESRGKKAMQPPSP